MGLAMTILRVKLRGDSDAVDISSKIGCDMQRLEIIHNFRQKLHCS